MDSDIIFLRFSPKNLLRDEVIKIFRSHEIHAERYLDVGCGNGAFTVTIAMEVGAKEAYGVDLDEECLKKLPNSIKGLEFDLEELAQNKLPFASKYLDLITAIEVIEHLSCGDHLLTEVRTILKLGGYFLVTVPNLASWLNRLLLLFGFQPSYTAPSKYYHVGLRKVAKKSTITNYGHKNLYTLKALKHMLELYGFEIITIRGCQSTYDPFSWLPVSNFPSLAPNIIFLARRKKNCVP